MDKLASSVWTAGIVVLVAATSAAQGPTQDGVALPEPTVTRQRLFSVPFFFNSSATRPPEVVLYVSGDQGRNWFLYQRRTADKRKFDFHAGEDGEYWFVVRAGNAQPPPTAATRPEKIVIVDQSKPQLEMRVEVGPTGQLVANWRADDERLDSQTFQLQYQERGDDRWQPVTVRVSEDPQDASFRGEVSWAVGQRDGDVLVRAQIMDRAGNQAVVQDRVLLHRVARRRAATRPTSTTEEAARAEPPRRDGQPDLERSAAAAQTEAPRAWDHGWRSTIVASDAAGPLNQVAGNEADGGLRQGVSRRDPHLGRLANETVNPSQFGLFDPLVDPLDSTSRAAVDRLPVESEYLPPVANQLQPDRMTSELRPLQDKHVQMTNSPRFHLDYELSNVGDAGVARVELWVTRDDGRSWSPYGVDPDLVSPFLVELEDDGIYGFRLLIHNTSGASAKAPQPGDTADLWVGLDRTRPEASIVSAQFGQGLRKDELEIKWQAHDDHLTERPILLSYAERPAGPWILLSDPLPNTGFYYWRLEMKLPPKIFLKIEVRDRAGNQVQRQFDQPVSTIRQAPTGRIRSLRPVN